MTRDENYFTLLKVIKQNADLGITLLIFFIMCDECPSNYMQLYQDDSAEEG